jgi:hypothetical protein
MINNTFNIVSYLSNEKGTEKISLIYDTINKRVIEKWISYQLDNDESKFIIIDRFIYVIFLTMTIMNIVIQLIELLIKLVYTTKTLPKLITHEIIILVQKEKKYLLKH